MIFTDPYVLGTKATQSYAFINLDNFPKKSASDTAEKGNHHERFERTSVTLFEMVLSYRSHLDGIKTAHGRGMAR